MASNDRLLELQYFSSFLFHSRLLSKAIQSTVISFIEKKEKEKDILIIYTQQNRMTTVLLYRPYIQITEGRKRYK